MIRVAEFLWEGVGNFKTLARPKGTFMRGSAVMFLVLCSSSILGDSFVNVMLSALQVTGWLLLRRVMLTSARNYRARAFQLLFYMIDRDCE
jgi:hypothetical protein